MRASEIFWDGMFNLAAAYAKCTDETIEGLLRTSQIVPNVLIEVYKRLIDKKEIEPIENYPDKQKIWDKVKDWSMDREQKIKVAKCMYIIQIIKS